MRAFVAAVVLIAGCGYQAGAFRGETQPFPGQRATAGCLDLAIERRADFPNGHLVVNYAFGNRCDHPAVVDLARVAVVGRTADGTQFVLAAYDPRHEISALRIDGREVGHEAIAYPGAQSLSELCVDAASIAHAATPQWMCFASRPQFSEVP